MPFLTHLPRACLLATTLLLATATLAQPAPASLAPLLNSIQQRLALAEPVAQHKWQNNKPVADLAREQQVLARAEPSITAWELNHEYATRFLSAQIEANKLLQHQWLQQWGDKGPAGSSDDPTPDLVELRKQLDVIQKNSLAHLSEFEPHRQTYDCPKWITDGITALNVTESEGPALLEATQSLCSQGPQMQKLLKANSAWNAQPYERYPLGQPELSVLKVSIPANTTLDWHLHHSPNAAYILSGELTIEDRDGNTQRFKQGEALAEMVGLQHRGRAGAEAVELIVFYAGTPGLALSE